MANEPCGCGNRLPRIARIEGRSADLFWVGDEARHEYVSGPLLQASVDWLGEVREWQAVQQARNVIELRLELLPGTNGNLEQPTARLRTKLQELRFPESARMQLRIVPSVTPDPRTGKLRRMLRESAHAGKKIATE